MGIHKVILALAVILLMSGQLTAGAGAIVLDGRPGIPISDGVGMTPHGQPKSTFISAPHFHYC